MIICSDAKGGEDGQSIYEGMMNDEGGAGARASAQGAQIASHSSSVAGFQLASSSDDETPSIANVLAIYTYFMVRSVHPLSWRYTWHD
jgi:hypothetical protein